MYWHSFEMFIWNSGQYLWISPFNPGRQQNCNLIRYTFPVYHEKQNLLHLLTQKEIWWLNVLVVSVCKSIPHVKFLINHKGLIIPVFLLESWHGREQTKTKTKKITEHLQPLVMMMLRSKQRSDSLGTPRPILLGPWGHQAHPRLLKKRNLTNHTQVLCPKKGDITTTCPSGGLTWIWGVVSYSSVPCVRRGFSGRLLRSATGQRNQVYYIF